jgi:hypothetical protein
MGTVPDQQQNFEVEIAQQISKATCKLSGRVATEETV